MILSSGLDQSRGVSILFSIIWLLLQTQGRAVDVASESTFRLYGGDATSGRVEIFHGGRWGTVCNQAWDDTTDGDVLCRQLGYPGVITPGPHGPDPALMGAVDGPIHLTEIECRGSERSMLHCPHKDWDPSSGCNHSMDVFVQCKKPELNTPRLYNGTVPNEGRLEVWDGTGWSRLCRRSIGLQGAETVCHELGFGYLWYLDNYTAPFGNGLTGVLDHDFVCQWGHRRLRDCVTRFHGGWSRSCLGQTVTCSGTKLGFATLVGLPVGLCGVLTVAILGCMICYHTRQNKRTSRATPEQIFADLGIPLPDRPRDVTVNDLSPRPAYTVEDVEELPHPSYEVAGFDADRYKTNYWHA